MFAFNTAVELCVNHLLFPCQGQSCTAQGREVTSYMELGLCITSTQVTFLRA